MKADGKQCAYPKCRQRIIGGPISFGAEDPEWVIKMAMHGYCMKHGMQEFSNLRLVKACAGDEAFVIIEDGDEE